MYKIQANPSGTRSLEISDAHLSTIRKYQLFRNLVDSNGVINEQTLDKLKMNVRSLLESETGSGDKALLDLCLDIIYNNNMKAFGLRELVFLYNKWDEKTPDDATDADPLDITD